jgi:hypothetical protein
VHVQADSRDDHRPDLARSGREAGEKKGTSAAATVAADKAAAYKTRHSIRQAAMDLVARWGSATA